MASIVILVASVEGTLYQPRPSACLPSLHQNNP